MSSKRGVGGAAQSHSKELMSLAYIQAIITPLGLNHNSPKIDNYGVDITVMGKNYSGTYPKPEIDIQLKCSQLSAITFDMCKKEIIYDIPVHNYNELIGPNLKPNILVLHVVPNHQSDWMYYNKLGVHLKYTSYWLSLDGQPESTNKKYVRVRIPLSQQLTPEALAWIMQQTSDHGKVYNNGGKI